MSGFANVTVTHKAFSDRRVNLLAELAAYPGGHTDAFGRLTLLWSRCTFLGTDTPGSVEIRSCLGPRGEQHLVEAGLGELGPDGAVRVKGCEGMIEWFTDLQVTTTARAAGGRARAANAPRDNQGRLLPRSAARQSNDQHQLDQLDQQRPASPGNPDLISSPEDLDLVRRSDPPAPPELPDPPAIVGAERSPALPPPAPAPEPYVTPPELKLSAIPARTREDRRRKLIGDAWMYAALKHQALRDEGVDPDARACWGGAPGGRPLELLCERIDELLVGDAPDFEAAAEVLRNRVDVAAEEARKARHLDWFIPRRMWDPDSFSKGSAMSPAQVRRGASLQVVRAGPAKTEPEPPRHLPRLGPLRSR